jgi:hypothetical protein
MAATTCRRWPNNTTDKQWRAEVEQLTWQLHRKVLGLTSSAARCA